ncbi:MAG TPA: C40 family peptidase [Gaiellaceae bacterium]|nr:C40 family peptidase [Gaiellaceae bacterium]
MPYRVRLALLATALAAAAGHAGSAAAHPSRAVRVAAEQRSVVRYARRFLGVRYEYGGTSPRTGFDCSGFTRFVYARFGVELPHYSVAQFSAGRRVHGALEPGDLVFFDGLGHVGLYVGGGRFIHAPHTGAAVSIDTLGDHGSYDGAVRIL